MIFFKTLFIILLLCISNAAFSQRFANQVPQLKRYTPAEVTDSDYGIVIYNKLVQGIGGDSLRYRMATMLKVGRKIIM
jgi:hypothetical protein